MGDADGRTVVMCVDYSPTRAEIRGAISNICRCGTYNRVRAAIKVVAAGGNTKNAALAIQHADGSTT